MKQMKKLTAGILMLVMIMSCIPVYAANEEEAVVINAADYGADPTGTEDSTKAIQEALEAAREAEETGSSVTLEFPKGEYHIYEDHALVREYHTSNTNSIENPQKSIGILVEEHENLTIDGNDSLFMLHGKMMALAIVESRNITLKDFAWDFAVPTVVEMTVTGTGSNYTDYYIADCFPYTVSGNTIRWSSDLSPYTGEAYWSGFGHQPDGNQTYAVVGYHPEDEMSRNYYVSDGPLSNVSSISQLDENHVRVYYSYKNAAQSLNQRAGTVFELCGNAHREMAGAFTWESENVRAEGIDVHFMHGFGWLIQMSRDVYYKDCNLVPREHSGHKTVSFADGIHASGAAGELVFENCNFANTHDDPLNLHGTFTRVERRNDDHTLTLKYIHAQQGGFPQYHVGDQVQFFTRDTLESTDGESMYTVAEILQDTDESSDKKTMIIRFEEKLPINLSDTVSGEPKYVAENVTYAPAVTIRSCIFRNVPTRGVLCTTRNKVLIENNVFYQMSMATIYLSNDSDEWYESGPIRDMTIRNNVFYIKDIGRTAWNTAPAIYVHPVTKGGRLPDAGNPIHKNITIEGNTFYMDLDRVVEAESVENLTFRNNKIYRMNPEIDIEISLGKTTLAAGETGTLNVNAQGNTNQGSIDNLFQFKACKNVLLEGNTYDDGLKLCAVADSATIENGLTVKDEEIEIVSNAPAVSAAVSELRYASTDASVAAVDAFGNVKAKGEGTTEVFAYYEWNDTFIRSNSLEITVTGEAAEGKTLPEIVLSDGTAADNVQLNLQEGNTLQFEEKTGQEVVWSVADFETEGPTAKAEISADGMLTAVSEGIVWVKAAAGGKESKAAVIIYGGNNYGLNPKFSVKRDDGKYRYDAEKLVLTAQTGNDLYQGDNTLNNLFLYTPEISGDHLRTSVKVENLPVRVASGKWDTVSFILYSGDDDYYTIGKKSHFNGFATVKERSQAAAETGENSTANNQVTTAWLGMSKKGNMISLDYSLNGEDWTTAGTFEDTTFGNDYQIGFGTWGTTRETVFSEFRVGTEEMSYDELEAVFFTKTSNERPSAAGLSLKAEGTGVTAEYTFTDADGDAEGETLYRWTYDGKTTVTKTGSFSGAAAGEIFCQVYPVDEFGTPGPASECVSISFEAEDTAELYSAAWNGNVVYERGDKKEVVVKLPEEVKKAEMTYVSVNPQIGTVEILKNGTAVEGNHGNSGSLVLEVQDKDVITIRRNREEYKFTIETVASDVTKIERITLDTLSFDKTPAEGEKDDYLNAEESKNKGTIRVTADPETDCVEIRYGELRKALKVKKSGNIYSADYVLEEGVNCLYVISKAGDGMTEKQYILIITYLADTEPEEIIEEEPEEKPEVCEVFEDIPHGAWYEEAVQYVYDHGLMAGNQSLFKPAGKVTRAQLVTTLYRLEGQPEVTDRSACEDLTDVEGKWYENEVCWAYSNQITTGNTSTMKFNGDASLTREQLATFFYRYAEYKGYDTTASKDYSYMLNADKVHDYAAEKVKWAVGAGLISGSETTDAAGNKVYDLKPLDSATRAQLAKILQRFCEENQL